MTVQYTLNPSNPSAHIFTVTLFVEEPNSEGQVLSLPTWIPGSYMIREFAKNIVRMTAKVGQAEIPVVQTSKNTWLVESKGQPFVVEYEIYAWDMSVRMAHLDQTHGYCNGTSVFLEVEGQSDSTHRVLLQAPTDPMCKGWKVASTLSAVGEIGEFGWYEATNYDELIDHPIEMGTFENLEFEACGVPHEVAITGDVRYDKAKLLQDLQRICEAEIRFFGEPAPMDRYLFQVMAVDSGYGGLEHRASTSLICTKKSLPWGDDRSDAYIQFLGLCSHEYFHTWNVKRIKPAVFLPYDLNRETYTSLLWVFEGWTSYYDDLILLRCDLISLQQYLTLIGKTITRVYKGSALHKQSLAESSFTAWTKFYRQDENAPNAVISYYAKGALAALALDLHIRRETNNQKSLDDVMRALWTEFGAKGVGVPENGVERLSERITGLDLSDWFDAVVRGVGTLPLEELLSTVGVDLRFREPKSHSDLGGTPALQEQSCHMGCSFVKSPAGAKVRQVFDGGAAQTVGLSAGDVLIAIDGIKVTTDSISQVLGRYSVGETARLHFFRRDELQERSVVLQGAPFKAYYLTVNDDDDSASERRRQWLYGVE